MEDLLKAIGLTDYEVKVYKALLKLGKGTKTPIVREAKILSSKVYEVLDKLIAKGLVSSYVENKVTQYVPVHPDNIKSIFDDKIKKIEEQRNDFVKSLKNILPPPFPVDVQIFKGWKGLRSAMTILLSDLKRNDTYYILGANAGEDYEKAFRFFPKIVAMYDDKGIKRKVVFRKEKKHEAETYFQEHGRKGWNAKYHQTIGPMEIGISNNYVMISLLEKEPVVTLIHNKKIRDSYLHYFDIIWKLSK
tara:strand:+ start:1042 stop:1782 length:741 start_codon:yes stop_codon:yes gene_type:complete